MISVLSLVQDITERKNAEGELQQMNQELRNLSSHLQNIREEERIQIARDIHDELGQQLTGLKMEVTWLNKKLETADERTKEKVREMIDLIDETVKSVRRISSNLRPSMLDDLGLIAALAWHSQEVEKRFGIKVNFVADPPEIDLPAGKSTGLFRIYQEALTNAARHANAHEINSSLKISGNKIILEIRDDGKGINLDRDTRKKSFGLLGIKERAFVMGGKFELKSERGKGTSLIVSVPLEN